MTMGVTVTIVRGGVTSTVSIEELYQTAKENVPSTLIVSMHVPNLQVRRCGDPAVKKALHCCAVQ